MSRQLPTLPRGPHYYRVRLMLDGRPVQSDSVPFALALDFTSGPLLLGTQAQLNVVLRRMLEQVRNIRAGELGRYYLDVALWTDDQTILLKVPVTWDPET